MKQPSAPTSHPARRWLRPRRIALALVAGLGVLMGLGALLAPPEPDVAGLLPASHLLSPQETLSGYADMHITPLHDRSLTFHLLIPRDWRSRSFTVTQAQLAADASEPVPLAVLLPERGGALVKISYQRVPASTSLQTAAEAQARRLGGRVLLRQPGSFNGRQVEDLILLADKPQLGPVLSRVTASREGDRVFFVQGSTQQQSYRAWREVLAAAAVSFTLQPPPASKG